MDLTIVPNLFTGISIKTYEVTKSFSMLRILPNGDVYVAIIEGGSRNQFTWAFRGRIFDFIPSKNLLIGQPFKGSTFVTSAPQSLSIAPAAGAAT